MITLITGTPGAGKTAFTVSQIQDLCRAQNRPLFVLGIPDLQYDHIQVPPLDEWTKPLPSEADPSLIEHVFTFPDGSLIVIDEAQQVFRPRPVGSKVPPHVSAFERHRHSGLDFYLITQHPNLLDSNIRRLVSRHIHIRASWSGRQLYELPESFDPNNRAELARAATRPYQLPKDIFSKYKSASIHTDTKRRIPLTVYALSALIIIMIITAYFVISRFSDQQDELRQKSEDIIEDKPQPENDTPSEKKPKSLPIDDPKLYKPLISNRPETAPIYRDIVKPVDFPEVVGCVKLPTSCKCRTQQGTNAGLSTSDCLKWIQDRPFRPWGRTGSYTVVISD